MKTLWIVVAVLVLAGSAYLLGRRTAQPTASTPGAVPAATTQSDSGNTGASGTSPTTNNPDQLALEIERALVAVDPQQRETAFAHLLPELLRDDPQRVARMVARQESGEARDALRTEVTRQWIRQDRDAAVTWMHSLESEAERRDSATLAVRTLAARSPPEAIAVADQFGVGRDDGSLEHMVQIWATEDPEAAVRWIESQPPDDPRTQQLRARIDQVRSQKNARP